MKTLTKRGLIDELSRKTILPKKDMERFLHACLNAIIAALKDGGKVQLIPFGTFLAKERKGREIKVPKTGAIVCSQTKRVPVFKSGKMLRSGIY